MPSRRWTTPARRNGIWRIRPVLRDFRSLLYLEKYDLFDPAFNYCFNSYYESHGPPARLCAAPHAAVLRSHLRLPRACGRRLEKLFARGVETGSELARSSSCINHEQQHQELILTDILALFAANPLRPAYRRRAARSKANRSRWLDRVCRGIHEIGHAGEGFAFDNETRAMAS